MFIALHNPFWIFLYRGAGKGAPGLGIDHGDPLPAAGGVEGLDAPLDAVGRRSTGGGSFPLTKQKKTQQELTFALWKGNFQ